MVQRNKSKLVRRVASKTGKSAKEATRANPVQQRGKLMLNNPLIPHELDEDVDDDLAFNSDDEALYGQFFDNKVKTTRTTDDAKSTMRRQGGGRHDAHPSSDDEIDSRFAAVAKVAGSAAAKNRRSQGKHTRPDADVAGLGYEEDENYSSDGDGYMDLSDMLDQSLAQERAAQVARGGGKASTTVLTEDGRRVEKKRRRGAVVTAQDESLYDTHATTADGASSTSYTAMLGSLVQRAAGSVEEKQAQTRLERALHNRHNLITVDEDETAKARITRREVRQVVERGLKKYQPTLRELSTAKHLQLPFRPPDSTPTVTSLGAVAAAAEARFSDAAAADDSGAPQSQRTGHDDVAKRFASKINRVLTSAGMASTLTPRSGSDEASRHAAHLAGKAFGEHVSFDDAAAVEGGERRGLLESDTPTSTTGYVSKLKAMLAAENSRRRRFNKIKSKTYRRILRKEKEHERERRQKAFELLHPDLARKRLAEKLAKARAEERVTQKHKNTSLWVKHVKRFAGRDGETRDAINEQLALHQQLMSKMEQGAGEELYEQYVADDARSETSSEEDRVVDALLTRDSDGSAAVGKGQQLTSVLWNSASAAATIGQGDDAEGAASDPRAKARAELMGMRFMKAARDREDKLLQEQMQALQEDVRRYHENGVLPEADGGMDSSARSASDAVLARSERGGVGRRSFAARSSVAATEIEKIERKTQAGMRAAADGDAVGQGGTNNTLVPQAATTATIAASEFAGDRAMQVNARACTGIVVRPQVAATGEDLPSKLFHSSLPGTRRTVDGTAIAASPLPNEAQVDVTGQQQYLISRAFAQDDVDDDFVRQKEAEVEVIMRPEDANSQLPGWGEWGGEDSRLNARHHERVAHAAVQKQIEKSFLLSSRADAALSHVIINHDGVELVPDRMTLHMIPRPFSNPQEFARSLRQPSGPEWTSALAFKESTQPRVEVRQGQTVTPLDLSLRPKRNKTRRRKTDKID